jgi:hypothetical protein
MADARFFQIAEEAGDDLPIAGAARSLNRVNIVGIR